MKFLYVDLEIIWDEDRWPTVEEMTQGVDLWEYWPFYITVAATRTSNMTTHWHEADYSPWGLSLLAEFIFYLEEMRLAGYKIFFWNGTGFDYRVLAQTLPTHHRQVVTLSQQSYDPALQILCDKGYPVGLARCAAGFGLEGKSEDGADAPQLWYNGEYERVCAYVEQDVVVLESVVQAIIKNRGYRWVTKAGHTRFHPIQQVLTAEQSLLLPSPDVSWMDNPITREQIIMWWPQEAI